MFSSTALSLRPRYGARKAEPHSDALHGAEQPHLRGEQRTELTAQQPLRIDRRQ